VSWEYYDHWVEALVRVVNDHGLLDDGYVGPRDREDDHKRPLMRLCRAGTATRTRRYPRFHS
jgi:hypothetical protein